MYNLVDLSPLSELFEDEDSYAKVEYRFTQGLD